LEIPALERPKPFTMLDEFRIVNSADTKWSKAPLLEKQGQIGVISTMKPSELHQLELIKLFLARKKELHDILVED